jgi:hypothetical protein
MNLRKQKCKINKKADKYKKTIKKILKKTIKKNLKKTINMHGGNQTNKIKSKKILKKTIDNVYDQTSKEHYRIKKQIAELCEYDDNTLEIFPIRHRETIIQLASKLGMDEYKLNKLSNDELCINIEDKLGFTTVDYVRSIFYPLAQLVNYGTSGFINAINTSTSELLLNNKIVYVSALGDLQKVSIKQKAQWALEGGNTLVSLKMLLNEINVVNMHGNTTAVKDIFRKNGIRSRFFIGKITPKQSKQLDELRDTLKYNIEKTSNMLFELQEDEKVIKEVNNIQRKQLKEQEIDIMRDDLKYNKENIRIKQVDKYGSVAGNVMNAVENITPNSVNTIAKIAIDNTTQQLNNEQHTQQNNNSSILSALSLLTSPLTFSSIFPLFIG